MTVAVCFPFPFLFQPRRFSRPRDKDGSGPTPIPAMSDETVAQPASSIWLVGCSWLLRPLETGPGGPKSVLSSSTSLRGLQADGAAQAVDAKSSPTGCEDLPVVRAEGGSVGATVYSPRASDWMAIMGRCFTPGNCHFAPRHLLVRGVLNSHRNLESHQVTLPSSSSQYIYLQGIAEHRDQRASLNCFLSRHDQRGSSDAMDDSQITCDLKDKAQEPLPTFYYLSPIQHLHYEKPCPSPYPVISGIKRPAHTLPLQDLSLQPPNISLFLSCILGAQYFDEA